MSDLVRRLSAHECRFSREEAPVSELTLVAEWAPLVYLAPDEEHLPLGVTEFLRHVTPTGNSAHPHHSAWHLVTRTLVGKYVCLTLEPHSSTRTEYYDLRRWRCRVYSQFLRSPCCLWIVSSRSQGSCWKIPAPSCSGGAPRKEECPSMSTSSDAPNRRDISKSPTGFSSRIGL